MLIERIAAWREATFSPPASNEDLAAAATALGSAIPQQLSELLIETNGVEGEFGLGLVWEVGRIAKDNAWLRTNDDYRELALGMPDGWDV